MADYRPIVTCTRMSDYGYWVITVSIAPGRRASIMVPTAGTTRAEAIEQAFESFVRIDGRKDGT